MTGKRGFSSRFFLTGRYTEVSRVKLQIEDVWFKYKKEECKDRKTLNSEKPNDLIPRMYIYTKIEFVLYKGQYLHFCCNIILVVI